MPCDRLFGANDALTGRVAKVPRGHTGTVLWDGTGLTFRRRPRAAVEPDASALR
ncbi:hypothetical protein ACLBXO_20280 [Methylobacterium sp. C33D]|uniref:hypothetical protein n=1 Tax=Methylobacterium mesophilicum TaxID=39956 RepID=UPI002F3518A4